jgi:hypothetical protein
MNKTKKSDEFEVFENALKKVLSVSRTRVQAKLKAEKATRKVMRAARKG